MTELSRKPPETEPLPRITAGWQPFFRSIEAFGKLPAYHAESLPPVWDRYSGNPDAETNKKFHIAFGPFLFNRVLDGETDFILDLAEDLGPVRANYIEPLEEAISDKEAKILQHHLSNLDQLPYSTRVKFREVDRLMTILRILIWDKKGLDPTKFRSLQFIDGMGTVGSPMYIRPNQPEIPALIMLHRAEVGGKDFTLTDEELTSPAPTLQDKLTDPVFPTEEYLEELYLFMNHFRHNWTVVSSDANQPIYIDAGEDYATGLPTKIDIRGYYELSLNKFGVTQAHLKNIVFMKMLEKIGVTIGGLLDDEPDETEMIRLAEKLGISLDELYSLIDKLRKELSPVDGQTADKGIKYVDLFVPEIDFIENVLWHYFKTTSFEFRYHSSDSDHKLYQRALEAGLLRIDEKTGDLADLDGVYSNISETNRLYMKYEGAKLSQALEGDIPEIPRVILHPVMFEALQSILDITSPEPQETI